MKVYIILGLGDDVTVEQWEAVNAIQKLDKDESLARNVFRIMAHKLELYQKNKQWDVNVAITNIQNSIQNAGKNIGDREWLPIMSKTIFSLD